MSYSISVVPTAPASLADAAAQAVENYTESLASQDYALTDETLAQVNKSVAVASQLAVDLYGDSNVYVGLSLVGHVNPDNASGTSCSLSLSTIPAPAQDVSQTQDAAPDAAPAS